MRPGGGVARWSEGGNGAKFVYDSPIMDRNAPTDAPAILDAANAAFIGSGVSINAASSRPGALPSLARGVGCRVSADRRSVTVLFASTPAAALLDDIRRSGAIAVVFSQPSTHRTLQLKGSNARIVPQEAGDGALTPRYTDAFIADLTPLGFSAQIVRTLLACDPDDIVAVQFSPSSAFQQTPGPSAGEPLAAPPHGDSTPPQGGPAGAA